MPDAYTVNIRGKPGKVEFPKICVRCCSPAAQSILIERAFGNDESGFHVVRLNPFFCPACIAEHLREARPVPFGRRIFAALKTNMTLAMAGPLLFGVYLVFDGLRKTSLIPIVIGLVFCLIGLGCFLAAMNRTAYLAVTPPTSVTATIQFTDDMSSAFEPAWRQFVFRNPDYGAAFTDFNRARIWDKHGTEALRAASRRFDLKIVGYLAFGALVLYWIYDDFLRPYL